MNELLEEHDEGLAVPSIRRFWPLALLMQGIVLGLAGTSGIYVTRYGPFTILHADEFQWLYTLGAPIIVGGVDVLLHVLRQRSRWPFQSDTWPRSIPLWLAALCSGIGTGLYAGLLHNRNGVHAATMIGSFIFVPLGFVACFREATTLARSLVAIVVMMVGMELGSQSGWSVATGFVYWHEITEANGVLLGIGFALAAARAVVRRRTQQDRSNGLEAQSRGKRRSLVVLMVLTLLVLLGIAVAGRDCRLVTGDFCDIKITSLKVGPAPFYQVSLHEEDRHSRGITVKEQQFAGSENRGGGGHGSGTGGPLGILAGPSAGSSSTTFPLNPDGDPIPESEIRRRLLVREGQSLRLKPGERLQLYKFKDSQSVEHEGWIEVEPFR